MLVAFVAEAMPGVLAHAVQRQHLRASDMRLVADDDHTAFAGCYVLGCIETEAAKRAKCARLVSSIFCFYGVGAIFDHDQAMLFGDRYDVVHSTCASGEMYG